jgi:hypothetical protein
LRRSAAGVSNAPSTPNSLKNAHCFGQHLRAKQPEKCAANLNVDGEDNSNFADCPVCHAVVTRGGIGRHKCDPALRE